MRLPWLAISGNKIVEQGSDQPVLLRGVNLSGLEYSSPEGEGSLQKAKITSGELAHIVTDWRANIVRLPINQSWALTAANYDPEPYLKAIDFVVNTLAEHGAYTLIDLQWLDACTVRGSVQGRANFVAPLPNGDSMRMWRQLATRWSDEPAVLYDIFNEPHDPLPDDGEPLLAVGDDGTTVLLRSNRIGPNEWHPWARALTQTIRNVHPRALVFVSGLNWAYDLSSFPIPDLLDVVYSTHVYPSKGRRWRHAFGKLSRTVPVFAAEWGGGVGDLAWGRRLLSYFHELAIGWTAWSWSDDPQLTHRDTRFTPTDFGGLVRDGLRSEG